MSVRLMAEIFETEFRDLQDADGNTTKASTAKFICIALADHANDEGEGAYPSLAKIAHKTSLSRTCVINAMDALKYNGIALAAGTSKWDTVNYTINRACFSQIEGSKSRVLVNPVDSPQLTQLTPPVNPVDPNHTITIHKTKDVSLSKSEMQEAGKKVDKILAMQNPNAWQGREHIRADLLPLADWYNRVTNQVMTKRVQKAWWKALGEWKDECLQPEHLQAAYDNRIAWRKIITDPNELTKDAAAIKAAGGIGNNSSKLRVL